MTIRRYEALQRHWARFPPLPRLAAWYFGFGKDAGKKPEKKDLLTFYQEMTGQSLPG